jgi:hypothetical protein
MRPEQRLQRFSRRGNAPFLAEGESVCVRGVKDLSLGLVSDLLRSLARQAALIEIVVIAGLDVSVGSFSTA